MQEQDRIMQVAILKLAKDKKVNAIASPIFLITSSLTSLHHSLREPSSRISAISIPYPDPQERLKLHRVHFESVQRRQYSDEL